MNTNTNTNPSNVMDKLRQYALLMRLDKPIGILLLLWPTLWALWIASEGQPTPSVTGVLIAGVILMRSAGCVINDYADRDFDGEVERTHHRPLATGEVSPREALILFATLVAIAFLLVLSLNTLTVQLAFVAVVLAVCYPYMKRYTYLPQAWLGLAFGWSVPMAFAAQTGSVPAIAWLLLIATVLWALAYDTMYAMVDRVDDLRIGIKSTAILFDDADRLIIGLIQGLMLVVLIIVGNKAELGWPYHFGLAFATALGLYQQYLIRRREPARCFIAFRNNGLLGACIYAGLVINYLIK